MLWMLFLAAIAGQLLPPTAAAFNVSAIEIGAPTAVAELDLGKLQGDLRQIGWSSDGAQLYVQTITHANGAEIPLHYVLTLADRSMKKVLLQPDWAKEYWTFKSDRSAPGISSIVIAVDQGMGSKGGGELIGVGGGSRFEPTTMTPNNVQINGGTPGEPITRLLLYGQVVSEFVDQDFVPGQMFGWGPNGTGAIAFTDRNGRLSLLDGNSHKQMLKGVKDAMLPAWSTDGKQLAYVQKTGRRKYSLVVVSLTSPR